MLPVGWFVVAVLLAILLTTWVTFTLTRLDRLHARVDAAEAALDAQLVRRAVAVQRMLAVTGSALPPADRAAFAAAAQAVVTPTTTAPPAAVGPRQELENAVGRAVTELLALPGPVDPAADGELREAAARVLISRRFYNDAVRDTRSLRAGRMPRVLHLAGRRAEPDFFDIDDTLPPAAVTAPRDARLEVPGGGRVPAPLAPLQFDHPMEEDR